ncbi:MAG: hypothetical protein K6B74_12060, partial [Ruminococcus sp.]|nr:hypothetical protein [Ruminococcus sp.]
AYLSAAAGYAAAAGYEKYAEYSPSDEEMSGLVQLAREQYNAILGRDPDAYFRTLNIREMFDHGDYKSFHETMINHPGREGFSEINRVKDNFETLLWDKVCIDDPTFASGEYWDYCEDEWDEENPEAYTSPEEKAAAAYQQALDTISADFYRTADPYSKNLAGAMLTSDYFYPVYNSDTMDDFKSVGSGAVCSGVTLYSAIKVDGDIYIEFAAEFTDGSETVKIPHACGWIKDGESGALVSLTEWTIYGKDTSVVLPEADEQALIKLAVEQYNAIVTRDAEAYLKTVNLDKALEGLTKEEILKRWESLDYDLPVQFAILLDCATYKDPSLIEPFFNDELLAEKYDGNQQNAAHDWYEAAAELTGKVTPALLDEMDKDESIRGRLLSNYFMDYDYMREHYGELSHIAVEDTFIDEEPFASENDDGTVGFSAFLRYKNGEDTRFLGRIEGVIYEDGSMSVILADIIPDGEVRDEEDYIDDANRGD